MKRLEPMWDCDDFDAPEEMQADDYDGHNFFRGALITLLGTVALVGIVTALLVVVL